MRGEEMAPLEYAQIKLRALLDAWTGLDIIPTSYGVGILMIKGLRKQEYFFFTNANEVLADKILELTEEHGKKDDEAEKICRTYLNIQRKYLKDIDC